MTDDELQTELSRVALLIAQCLPGCPFLLLVGNPNGGTLSLGNTDKASQVQTLRNVLASFEGGSARTTIDGPALVPCPTCRAQAKVEAVGQRRTLTACCEACGNWTVIDPRQPGTI